MPDRRWSIWSGQVLRASLQFASRVSKSPLHMYQIVVETTGAVLAKALTLDGVDQWLERHKAEYCNLRTVGMTVFVAVLVLAERS